MHNQEIYSEWPSESFNDIFEDRERDYTGIGLFALGALIGAGFMFLLDPRGGGRRRALIRDKVARGARVAKEYADKRGRDAINRARGTVEEVKARARDVEGVPDRTLVDRVRAQIGHVVAHPSSIEVIAENGKVILRGAVRRGEVAKLRERLEQTRGVKDFRFELSEHEGPGMERIAG
jgi:hyperosmotically inducible protein